MLNAINNKRITNDVTINFHDTLLKDKVVPDFEDEEQAGAQLYKFNLIILDDKAESTPIEYFFRIMGGRNFEDGKKEFFENYIEPIIRFLHDHLDEGNSVLYLLEKYKKRVEWFMKDTLLLKYRSVAGNYEQVFEDDLRIFLFDQGIDYPFSTPKSASGRADIVGLIDTKNPLIIEIKIYDTSKSYKKNRIISGFSQIVKYTNDYNKNVGYLVVFNIDNVEIQIDSEDSDNTFPNRIIFDNKTYYIVFVNLNIDSTASKVGTLKVETLTKEELTQPLD